MAKKSSRVAWLALALLFAATGCVKTTMVRMPMQFAPRLPVRVFPSVWIAGGQFDEDQRLADRLAAHLANDEKIEVRRVDLSELEPARLAGKIPPSTAVVILDLELRDGIEEYWDTMPMQSCGYYGCATYYGSYVSRASEVTAMVTVTVHEGPTSRVLQRERVGRSVVGSDPESVRMEVVELLADEVDKLVDTLRLTERVTLYESKLPAVQQALARIEKGDWKAGRTLLEGAKAELGGMKPRQQARIWYDLGFARRFAPGAAGLDQAAYEASRRAFKWALRLDPRSAYERALTKLERHYQSEVALAEQEEARKHNFALPAVPVEEAPADAVVPGDVVPPPPAPDATPAVLPAATP